MWEVAEGTCCLLGHRAHAVALMADGVHGTSVLLRMEGRASFKTADDEESDTEMGF